MHISVQHKIALDNTKTCSMDGRLQNVQHWCDTMGEIRLDFTHLTYKQLQELTHRILVDEKHKVLFCMIAKAG